MVMTIAGQMGGTVVMTIAGHMGGAIVGGKPEQKSERPPQMAASLILECAVDVMSASGTTRTFRSRRGKQMFRAPKRGLDKRLFYRRHASLSFYTAKTQSGHRVSANEKLQFEAGLVKSD